MPEFESTQVLQAGRDLDVMIAEKVFGHAVRSIFMGHSKGIVSDDGHPLGELPRYSTDLDAAWLVVEKMKALEYWPSISWLVYWDNKPYWYAEFKRPPASWDGRAETVPLAICRATMFAMEHRTWRL